MIQINSTAYCIVVTYNAMPWVDECLGSLVQSSFPITPIVVDNCSSDGTVSHIQTHFPDTIIIQNESNRGFGQANNQGIEYAYKHGGEYFFLLNQDAYIYPDTIARLVSVLTENKLAVVSPIHLNKDGSKLDGGFFDCSVMKQRNVQFVSDLVLNHVKPYYEVRFVNAAAWLISRRCVEQIGGFDPIFFHYGEDVNYCQRLQYHNMVLGVVPDAFIHHCRKDDSAGNSAVYNDRAYIMNLLINTADVNSNKSFWSRLNVFRQIKNILLLFFQGRFSSCRKNVSACRSIVAMKKEIDLSIKKNKQKDHNWLIV